MAGGDGDEQATGGHQQQVLPLGPAAALGQGVHQEPHGTPVDRLGGVAADQVDDHRDRDAGQRGKEPWVEEEHLELGAWSWERGAASWERGIWDLARGLSGG